MVKKLFKHEYFALLRLVVPVWCALLCVSVFGRLVLLLENDTIVYKIVNGSSILFYVVALLACIASPFVFAVVRFYRNLFSGEGYLMFTLPVTPAQHLWVKLTVAVTTQIATLLLSVSSLFVLTFGDLGWEIGKAAWYLLSKLAENFDGHMPFLIVEAAVSLVAMFTYMTLLYYGCICIGQLSKKNRILAAIGAYFGFYIIGQVLSTMLMIVFAFVDFSKLSLWISQHTLATAHIVLCSNTLQYLVLAGVFYFISHYIIRHRLNLE